MFGEQTPALSTSKRDDLVSIAESLTEDVFGGRTGRNTIIEGDENDFAKYVAAHLWEQAEGGEPSGQTQTGGSVNYQHLTDNLQGSLGDSRFGRIALMFIREDASVSVVRSDF